MITRVRFPQAVEVVPRDPRSEYVVCTLGGSGFPVAAMLESANGDVLIKLMTGEVRRVIPHPGTVFDVEPDEPAASPPASRAIPAEQRKTRR